MRSAMASFLDCCRVGAVAPNGGARMQCLRASGKRTAELGRCLSFFFVSTGGLVEQTALLVSRLNVLKFAAEISVAVNVGEWALLGPMLAGTGAVAVVRLWWSSRETCCSDKTGGPVCSVASTACVCVSRRQCYGVMWCGMQIWG